MRKISDDEYVLTGDEIRELEDMLWGCLTDEVRRYRDNVIVLDKDDHNLMKRIEPCMYEMHDKIFKVQFSDEEA